MIGKVEHYIVMNDLGIKEMKGVPLEWKFYLG